MNEPGAHDLQQIEQALLADDPQFTAQFRRATEQLGSAVTDVPPGPIVVAVDGTLTSMQAVHWAAMRARTSDADIRIVHAFRWRSYPLEYGMAELQDLSGQEAGQEICRSAVDLASAVAPATRVTGTLVSGTAGPAIVQATADAALLVLGGSRLSATKTLLSASTVPYVIARVRCSVAVLPSGGSAPAEPGTAPSRVCVGVAGGAGDTAALAEALRIARASNHELLVVCAAGAEQATRTALAMLRRHVDVPAVEQMTAKDQVVNTLIRLAPSSQAIVCDRSHVILNSPLRGRAGRRLVHEACCPLLLTYAAANDLGRR